MTFTSINPSFHCKQWGSIIVSCCEVIANRMSHVNDMEIIKFGSFGSFFKKNTSNRRKKDVMFYEVCRPSDFNCFLQYGEFSLDQDSFSFGWSLKEGHPVRTIHRVSLFVTFGQLQRRFWCRNFTELKKKSLLSFYYMMHTYTVYKTRGVSHTERIP